MVYFTHKIWNKAPWAVVSTFGSHEQNVSRSKVSLILSNREITTLQEVCFNSLVIMNSFEFHSFALLSLS